MTNLGQTMAKRSNRRSWPRDSSFAPVFSWLNQLSAFERGPLELSILIIIFILINDSDSTLLERAEFKLQATG